MGYKNGIYGVTVGDDLGNAISDMLNGWDAISSTVMPWRDGMKLIDQRDYDIIPKKHVIERRLKEREEDLSRVRQKRENDKRYYDEKEKELKTEIEYLRGELDKANAKAISP